MSPLRKRMLQDNGWFRALLRDNVELVIFSFFAFTDEFLIPELMSNASIVRLVPSAPSTGRLAAVTAASAHRCFMVVAQPARLLAVF